MLSTLAQRLAFRAGFLQPVPLPHAATEAQLTESGTQLGVFKLQVAQEGFPSQVSDERRAGRGRGGERGAGGQGGHGLGGAREGAQGLQAAAPLRLLGLGHFVLVDGGDAARGPEACGPLQEQEFHLVLQLRVQLLERVILEVGEAGRSGGVQAGGGQGAPAGREGPRTAAGGQALHAAGEAGAGGVEDTERVGLPKAPPESTQDTLFHWTPRWCPGQTVHPCFTEGISGEGRQSWDSNPTQLPSESTSSCFSNLHQLHSIFLFFHI